MRVFSLVVVLALSGCLTKNIKEEENPGSKSGARAPEARKLAFTGSSPILSEDGDVSEIKFSMFRNIEIYKRLPKPPIPLGLYSNPDAPAVADFISSATSSVDIEIYEMSDLGVREALRRALKNKIRVRIIKEPRPVGQKCDPFAARASRDNPDCVDQKKLFKEIQQAGGKTVPFNKEQLCGQVRKSGPCFQHGKMVLVDGRQALLSTGNFNSSNLCNLEARPSKCNRDFSYITADPEVVTQLGRIFEKDLAGKRYALADVLSKGTLKRKLTVSPFSFAPLKEFMRTAQRKIQIQNQYIRDPDFVAELIYLASKVQVEIQLSDICNYGSVSEKLAYESDKMFRALEDAGVKIKMFHKRHRIRGKPGYLHSKAIVVDGERAWVGSVNLSSASLNQNREFGIFFNQPSRAQAFSEFLTEDFENPTNITWQKSVHECRRRPQKGTDNDDGVSD